MTASNIDPAIFEHLQAKIDEEGRIKDELKDIIQQLEKQGRVTQSILSRIHNTPTGQLAPAVLQPCKNSILTQIHLVKILSNIASKHPFYKWNNLWTREMQNLIFCLQLRHWLAHQELETIEQVGNELGVPINVKDRDIFHLTIEEYLLALTNTIDELTRLAPNAVTLGDFSRPLQISKFIKDIHAGFQLLNLKNDTLRRRSDGIKYAVKKVEDVVYDLSLRGLLPKQTGSDDTPAEAKGGAGAPASDMDSEVIFEG